MRLMRASSRAPVSSAPRYSCECTLSSCSGLGSDTGEYTCVGCERQRGDDGVNGIAMACNEKVMLGGGMRGSQWWLYRAALAHGWL
jgi:hypothetical protein